MTVIVAVQTGPQGPPGPSGAGGSSAEVDPMQHGAVGDGIVDDTAAVAAVIALGIETILLSKTHRITGNLSFASTQTLRVLQGGGLKPDSGKTITINGPVDAGHTQKIFSGPGKIVFSPGREIHAMWFSPPMDGASDDSVAIQAALDSVPVDTTATIVLPPTPTGINAPYLTNPLRVQRGHVIRGHGGILGPATRIYTAAGVTGIICETYATSADGGRADFAELRDFAIEGVRVTVSKWAALTLYGVGAVAATTSLDAGVPALLNTSAEPRFYLKATVGGTSGAAEPLNPGPLHPSDPQFPNVGIGHTVTDGGVTWQCVTHSGIYSKTQVKIRNVRINGFTNCGILFAASIGYTAPAGPGAANGGGAQDVYITQCGVGIAALGTDANGPEFTRFSITDPGYNLYGHAFDGGVGIYDDADVGARWVDGVIDTVDHGRGVYGTGVGFPNSLYAGIHEEGSIYLNHIGGGSVIGGYYADGFTNNTAATVLVQSRLKNWSWNGTPSDIGGVKTNLVIPGYNDQTSPGSGIFAAGSDDNGGGGIRWRIHYGVNGITGTWGIKYASESDCFAWTTSGAQFFEGTAQLAGEGMLWIPKGSFHGSNGGYPNWYSFDNASDVTGFPTLVRGGRRVAGDRYNLPDATTFGDAALRVVTTGGYNAVAYPGGTVTSAAGNIINANTYRSSTTGFDANGVANSSKVFRCTTSGATAGAGEPSSNAATTPGVSTITDGSAVWTYIGNTPLIGTTALGMTLTGTSTNGGSVVLLDEYSHELTLPATCSFALRITVLGSRTDAAARARDVYEVLCHTNASAVTIDDTFHVNTTGGIAAAGWTAPAFSASGLNFRITCQGVAAQTVAFKARVEMTQLGGHN